MSDLLSDIEALRKDLVAGVAEAYGLKLEAKNAERGEFILRDAFGPIANVYSDALRRVEGGLARMVYLVKCADAIAKENKRLRAELAEWRTLIGAAEELVAAKERLMAAKGGF